MFGLASTLKRPRTAIRAKFGSSGTVAAVVAVFTLLVAPGGPSAGDEARLWDLLKSGEAFALLRHAVAPGTGDPSNFVLGDCQTQRNLSDPGRAQAARIGVRFRKNGIERARVLSSQWCRCLETARLLGLGPVAELPALNSFYRLPERRERQTEALQLWLSGQAMDRPIILVTHQVNITALTGLYPASGELVVVGQALGGDIAVLGSIRSD